MPAQQQLNTAVTGYRQIKFFSNAKKMDNHATILSSGYFFLFPEK